MDAQTANLGDPVMELVKRANARKNQGYDVILACIGKASFPGDRFINQELAYWKNKLLFQKINGDIQERISGYGDPRGDANAREKMAEALNVWYFQNKPTITPDNILFTVGGAAGLFAIFAVLHQRYPNFRLVTQVPCHTLYFGAPAAPNRLHLIDIMQETGYQLTATVLRKSLDEAHAFAKLDHGYPAALLICDPNNPLGTVIEKKEWEKIATVLEEYPDLYIILDEAYAELGLYTKPTSFIEVASPKLRERIIVLRSGTKGLSASGERFGMVVCFDSYLLKQIETQHIFMAGHAPRSGQAVYAETLCELANNQTLQEALREHYRTCVHFVENKVRELSAQLPNQPEQTEGSFYVLINLEDLLTHATPDDESISHHLLDHKNIAIAPLSYYGADAKKGYLRITCNDSHGDQAELKKLMQRLEEALKEARIKKIKNLSKTFQENQLATLSAAELKNELASLQSKAGMKKKWRKSTLNEKPDEAWCQKIQLPIDSPCLENLFRKTTALKGKDQEDFLTWIQSIKS